MHRHFYGLKPDRAEASGQTIHHIAHLAEPLHATRPSLDMLAQRAERDEFGAARGQVGAPVYPLVVDGAFQVSIEAVERIERRVAQVALECLPVPRARRGPRRRIHRGLVPSLWPSDQPRGVRDNVLPVHLHDSAVEHRARHTRRAGARLKVERERRGRDK